MGGNITDRAERVERQQEGGLNNSEPQEQEAEHKDGVQREGGDSRLEEVELTRQMQGQYLVEHHINATATLEFMSVH